MNSRGVWKVEIYPDAYNKSGDFADLLSHP
jgi:hypothetical protein